MTGEFNIFDWVPAICLVGTLLIASVADVVSHRIPNVLLAPALTIAILISLLENGVGGLLTSLAGLGIGLLILMPLYLMRAMGAGDVKLLGVAGAFLGPLGALVAGLATLIVGGIYGILWIVWRALGPGGNPVDLNLWLPPGLITRFPSFAMWLGSLSGSAVTSGAVATMAEKRSKSTFAYAPAIAAGGFFAMWQQGWFAAVGF